MLVDRAWRAGIRTMSVTDHDTMAARAGGRRRGRGVRDRRSCPASRSRPSHEGRDVHVLGYFIDAGDARARRVSRAPARRPRPAGRRDGRQARRHWASRSTGKALLALRRAGGRSLGRPMVAQALVKAGHVIDTRQAFDQLIGEGSRHSCRGRARARRSHRDHRPRVASRRLRTRGC